MTEETKQISLDKWDDFAGEFLKADLIKSFPVVLVPIAIETEEREGKKHLYLKVEYNSRTWLVEVNKTNQNYLRANGVMSPNALIGKKLTFNKIQVRNPTTHTIVDSLAIVKIE